jgi:hypothetical protein
MSVIACYQESAAVGIRCNIRALIFMFRKRFLSGQSKGFLYADLALIGGLAPTLQRLLNEVTGDPNLIKCDGGAAYAFIPDGPNHSTVSAADNERNFNIDLWYQGVLQGSGWTSDLREIARAVVAFHRDKSSISEIAVRFEWLKPSENADSHQRGAEFFVTKRWEDLARGLASEQFSYLNALLPLVLEAAKRPELRRLLPFTSLTNLCFSRTTGYPYTHDCPSAWPLNGGAFRITASDGETILGDGDAVRAADLLAANLPQNCGSAVHRTAEDLEGTI